MHLVAAFTCPEGDANYRAVEGVCYFFINTPTTHAAAREICAGKCSKKVAFLICHIHNACKYLQIFERKIVTEFVVVGKNLCTYGGVFIW